MKTWKLEAAEPIGITIMADAMGFEHHDDGYNVRCAHCDEIMIEGYKPSPSIIIEVLTCQHCGGLNRFDTSPPQG